MSAAQARAGAPNGAPARTITTDFLVRLIIAVVANIFAFWLGLGLIGDGNWFLGGTIIVTAIALSFVNLRPELWPLRWMTPGLALMMLLSVYPLVYTVYVAFTNYGDGNNFTKTQVVERLTGEKYLPAGTQSFRWKVFQDAAGNYGLWLTSIQDGTTFFALPGQALVPVTSCTGDTNCEDGVPTTYDYNGVSFRLLATREYIRNLADLQALTFGSSDDAIGIQSATAAGRFVQRWVYDETADTLTDLQTNIVYRADNGVGQFVSSDGQTAPLGYWVPIGFDNFTRIFTSPLVQGPLVRVFGWTFAFAFLSVITAFALGLLIALILNQDFPGVRLVRSLLIIPYAIPGIIGIRIWRGILDANLGVVTLTMEDLFGWAPPLFTDPGWAKFAILLVNLWFAFPYFMLICSGALQSIPQSIYEAADVDGANGWQKFWALTLPLLLVAVGPLLVASFTFNFNNFILIEALTGGGPPIPGTAAPPVGHTDNLISYTYRFAFSSGGSRDYGFASAIAIVIFAIVGTLTLFQFRFTRRLEEIGENV